MKGWHLLVCSCGAWFKWWGGDIEARFHKLNFCKVHSGHVVVEEWSD